MSRVPENSALMTELLYSTRITPIAASSCSRTKIDVMGITRLFSLLMMMGLMRVVRSVMLVVKASELDWFSPIWSVAVDAIMVPSLLRIEMDSMYEFWCWIAVREEKSLSLSIWPPLE